MRNVRKYNFYFTHSSSSSSCSGRIRFDSCSLYPQNEIGPSISSSVVLRVFVLLVYIVLLVQVSCLCPSSVCVVATFPGTVLFPLLTVNTVNLLQKQSRCFQDDSHLTNHTASHFYHSWSKFCAFEFLLCERPV